MEIVVEDEILHGERITIHVRKLYCLKIKNRLLLQTSEKKSINYLANVDLLCAVKFLFRTGSIGMNIH